MISGGSSNNTGTFKAGTTLTVTGPTSVLELTKSDTLGYYNASIGTLNLEDGVTMKVTGGHTTIGGVLNMKGATITATGGDAQKYIFDNQMNALSGENLINADSIQIRNNGTINVSEGAKLTITSDLSTGNVAKLIKNGAGKLVFDKSLWTPSWDINAGTLTLNAPNTASTLNLAGTLNATELTLNGTWNEYVYTTDDFGKISATTITFNKDLEFNLISEESLTGTPNTFEILSADNFLMSDNSSPDAFDWRQFLADEALWNLEYGYTDGKHSLTLVSLEQSTVPEPATWVILILGTAGVFVARNRNQKKN